MNSQKINNSFHVFVLQDQLDTLQSLLAGTLYEDCINQVSETQGPCFVVFKIRGQCQIVINEKAINDYKPGNEKLKALINIFNQIYVRLSKTFTIGNDQY